MSGKLGGNYSAEGIKRLYAYELTFNRRYMRLSIVNDNMNTVKRILKLLKPYTRKIIIVVVCTILSAAARVVYPRISQLLIDDGLIALNLNTVVKYSIGLLLVVIIIQCFSAVETKNRIYINSMLSFILSGKVLKKIFRLKLHYFNNTK